MAFAIENALKKKPVVVKIERERERTGETFKWIMKFYHWRQVADDVMDKIQSEWYMDLSFKHPMKKMIISIEANAGLLIL